MDTKNTSNPEDGFQVEDPLTVFKTFSSEEIRRCHETDPNFDAALHQKAVSLVLDRLKTRQTPSAKATQ